MRQRLRTRRPQEGEGTVQLRAKVRRNGSGDEPNDLVRLQVNGALAAGDTTVVVDSADPSVSAPGNNWGTASHLAPGDQLLVEPAADAATFDHEVIEVVAVQSDTTFTVTRGAQGTTPASIADDAQLMLLAPSYAEGTDAPSAVSRNPIKWTNKTQIFKHTYELTGSAVETATRTGDPVQNDKKRKLWDHSKAIEMAMLWGRISEVTGSNGKPKRTMDGLRAFVGNTKILTTNWDFASAAGNNFLDAVSPVFDWDTPAGDERIAFCGNGALNAINKKIHEGTGMAAVRIDESPTEVFRMRFMRFMLPQGTIFLRTHPLMNRHALYKNSMFVIDFASLRYRPHRNRDTKFVDNIQTKGEDVRRGFWQTDCSLEVQRGGLTCAYIGGFGA